MKRLAIVVTLLLISAGAASAQSVPPLVNYQGQLTDNTQAQDPISGTHAMEFRIYGSQAGSDLLWSETWDAVEVTDGLFSVLLGSQGTPIPPSVFSGQSTCYLETVVSDEILAPRQRLASVPFSHVADKLDQFEGHELEESAEIDSDIVDHDLDSGAHEALIASHGHDGRYYTEVELDAVVGWQDWQIDKDEANDKLQLSHPDAARQITPVMTLEPPTGTGNVGIGTTAPAEKLEVQGAIKIGDSAGSADGTIRYTGLDLEGRVDGTWMSLARSGATRVNVRNFGALGDGEHDDTDAVRAAMAAVAPTGGIVSFPEGIYRIDDQLVLPNDGATNLVRQAPLKFEGAGAFFDPRTSLAADPNGGSILDLRYTAGPKLATYGLGLFEAEGVTFADLGPNNDAIFIYTTNTTLHIHDSAFFGRYPGTYAENDAIVLGGTTANNPGGDDPNGPFQGYGTVIRDNFFGRIRRAVYGRVFANGVAFYGNTIWSNCSSNLPDGAAIELDGDPDGLSPQGNAGWYVAGNLIEVVSYPYGIKVSNSERNTFVGNNFYDSSEMTLAFYRFEESGRLNFVVAGMHPDNKPFVDDQATGTLRSTVINPHQNEESIYPQKARYLNKLFLEPGNAAPHGPRVVSPNGAELSYQLLTDNSMNVVLTPSGESPVSLWQVRSYGNGLITQELKGTDSRMRNANGPVRIQAREGSFVELGDLAGRAIRVDDGALEFNHTSARMMSGTGAPTDSAPNGSIYLRTDGGTGSTLYVRENGAWVAK